MNAMSEKDTIPGIHNWCDRWCEKCPFIGRCAVGLQELEFLQQEQKGNQPDFWKAIGEQLAKTIELIDELAKERGIDLSAIPKIEWEQLGKESKQQWQEGEDHPISQTGLQYFKTSQQVLNEGFIKNQLAAEIEKYDLGLEKEARNSMKKLKDAVDIIKWYHFFIPPKCQRLVMENIHKGYQDAEYPPEERMYNGTAKITLIAIERSIAAWGILLELVPEHEDEMLSVLALLQKLQRLIHIEFPDAIKFIRPGFDE
jgi:hypothetical protein